MQNYVDYDTKGMYFHVNDPIIGGVALELRTGRVSPAKFNRALVTTEDGGKTKMDEETMQMLMLGPLLIPR